MSEGLAQLEPVNQVKAGVLDIGYYETGPRDGSLVILPRVRSLS